MSRKHFQLIADAIRQIEDDDTRRQCADKLVEACRAANPRFDEHRFRKACNV